MNGRAERCRARAFFDASGALTASPVAAAEVDWARLDAIRDARVLSDGRLLLADGALGEDATLFVVFREIDGRWLIDGIGQIGELAIGSVSQRDLHARHSGVPGVRDLPGAGSLESGRRLV